MANSVKQNTVYAVEIEVTEGTYVAPTSATTSYVQTLADGAEMVPAKNTLERNVFNGSIGKTSPRTGTKTVTGAMPVEMRASDTEGAEPEYDALMRSAMGLRRQVTAGTVDNTDAVSAHTVNRIYILDADIGKYSVGDIVTVEVAGDYHTSPVTVVSATPGDAYIDLLISAANPFVDAQVIKAVTTYVTADSGHPSLSISKYIEGSILEQATGCRVNSMSLDSASTGELASFNYGFEGLNFDRSITAQPHVADFDSALPPIMLNACLYQDGVQIPVNELSFSLENTLGFATSTCSANGRISGRATERNVSGSFNPYKQDNNIDDFNRFNDGTEFSLSFTAYLPSAVAGEYGKIVSIYMPNCVSTELSESDQDGLLQENISFIASRGPNSSEEELYISIS